MPLVLFDGIAVSNTVAAPITAVPPLAPPITVTVPAVGSVTDLANRIVSLLPRGWFANTQGMLTAVTPSSPSIIGYGPPTGGLGSVIKGAATALSWIYSLIKYVANQTRRVTTSEGFLDLGLFDFFGLRVRRKFSQTDTSTRAMWKQEVLRRRVTRDYVKKAVADLTGTPVSIFEPFNPTDTGGFGAQWAFNEPTCAWGSSAYPYTMFITAVEPIGAGIPNLSGLNDSYGGFGAGQFALAELSLTTGSVTNQDIYDMINSTRAAGVTCWVNIGPPAIVGGRLDSTFLLDTTPLA